MSKFSQPYNVCVIDIGSPKQGNIGWCMIDAQRNIEHTGGNLDDLFPHIGAASRDNGLILGLEAPLFVPLRTDLLRATEGRKGEGSRPWSAGAGAQVLTMNLPIMVYILRHIQAICPNLQYFVNEENFVARSGQIMLFEAFVSGQDKGHNHVDDARILARACAEHAKNCRLPMSILQDEHGVEYWNLAAAALLYCGLIEDQSLLKAASPIYKP